MEQLRFSNEREAKAHNFLKANLVSVTTNEEREGGLVRSGTVLDGGTTYQPRLVLDADLRLVEGTCSCHFYIQNHLRQGPCEHMLALRLSLSER